MRLILATLGPRESLENEVMCAPLSPRLSLDRLGLDDLGMLVRHKRATPAVRQAFAQALRTWIEQRVRRLGQGRLQAADVDDLVQEFTVRCLTRHFCAWEPALCTLSAFLFHRLRCEVIDHQRLVCRRAARDAAVDDLELASTDPSPAEREERLVRERNLQRIDDAVAALPRRQKMVMRRTLLGEPLHTIARDAGVSHSTLSREKSQALQGIQAALAA